MLAQQRGEIGIHHRPDLLLLARIHRQDELGHAAADGPHHLIRRPRHHRGIHQLPRLGQSRGIRLIHGPRRGAREEKQSEKGEGFRKSHDRLSPSCTRSSISPSRSVRTSLVLPRPSTIPLAPRRGEGRGEGLNAAAASKPRLFLAPLFPPRPRRGERAGVRGFSMQRGAASRISPHPDRPPSPRPSPPFRGRGGDREGGEGSPLAPTPPPRPPRR